VHRKSVRYQNKYVKSKSKSHYGPDSGPLSLTLVQKHNLFIAR